MTLLFKLTNSDNETLTDMKMCFTCMKEPDSCVEKQSEQIFFLWLKSSLVQPDVYVSSVCVSLSSSVVIGGGVLFVFPVTKFCHPGDY